MIIFDPVLEPQAKTVSQVAETWAAHWIWFPGQLGAHLHTLISQKAFRRCTHIGYPGTFIRAEEHVFLRRSLDLPAAQSIRWSAPLGRTRVRINGREGDITLRQGSLPAGRVNLLVSLDMTESLPCFLLEGGSAASGAGWEASLDGENWAAAEFGSAAGSPERLPDVNLDTILPIFPREVVELVGQAEENGQFILEAGGRLLVDFWHDELGELVIEAQGEGKLSLAVGETIVETCDPDPDSAEQYPLAALVLDPRGSTHRLPERLVRYALLQADSPCRIQMLRLDARIYPVEYKGHFECSDESLNAIWRAGAATLHSNIHDGVILDGLKRDALVWLFDENIDFEGVQCVFFDHEVVRNTLMCLCPPPNLRPGDAGVPDNLFYFVIGFYQDYQTTGDPEFILRYRSHIQQILELLAGLQDRKGFIPGRAFAKEKSHPESAGVNGVDYLGEFFPDWGGKSDCGQKRPTDLDCGGTPAYAQMILMRCFEIGAQFAKLWADSSSAQRYSEKAVQLRQTIRSEFWDEENGAFINGLFSSGVPDRRFSHYAQSWALLSGMVQPGDVARLIDGILADPSLRPSNLSMSTYWEYLAYLKAGRFDRVLQALAQYWGGMLESGFSRFIEDICPQDSELERLSFYNRPYAMSLNHGWSGATPVSCLMRGVMGLQILEPGYSLVEMAPNWQSFAWARCKLPTPHGAITLDYTQQNGATITLPKGVRARVLLEDGIKELCGPGQFQVSHAR